MKYLIIWATLAYSLPATAQGSNDKSIDEPRLLTQEQQARIISKKIYDYHKGQDQKESKVLRVIYFHANDREPCKNYQKRWDGILKDFKLFFDVEMKRNGYPQSKFQLEVDETNKSVLHVIKGQYKESDKKYNYKAGRLIRKEIKGAMMKKGINIDEETILIICGFSTTKGDKVDIDSPFYGIGANQNHGTCFAMDSDWLEIPGLLKTEKMVKVREDHHPGDHYKKMPMSQFNITYIGGTIHELGHGLSLPHNKEKKEPQKKYGTALMGGGNYTYRREIISKEKKGSFLTHAHAIRLATHPLFSSSQKGSQDHANAKLQDMSFTHLNADTIAISGTVKSDIPNAAIVVYLDGSKDHKYAVNNDYDARNWTTVIDDDGKFYIKLHGPLQGKHQIRIVICHLNGSTTTYKSNYDCDDKGQPMLEDFPKTYEPRKRRRR